jgi:hypothetical protein
MKVAFRMPPVRRHHMVAGKRAGNPTKKRQTGPRPKKNGKTPEEPKQTAAAPTPAQEAPPPASEPATASPPPAGHNSGELDEQARKELMFVHMRQYKHEKEALDSATSRWRNFRKKVKAEGSKVTEIETMVKVETAEGSLTALAEMQRTAEIVSWFTGAKQVSFDIDVESRMSPIEKARRDATVDFYKGLGPTGGRWAPGSPEYQAYLDTHHELTANRVRGGIKPLAPTPLEEAILNAPAPVAQEPAVAALDASLDALDEHIDGFIQTSEQGPLDEATAAVREFPGEPMSEAELVAGLENAGYLPTAHDDILPPDPVEVMPPEPGMPRAEWKEKTAADLEAEKQFLRHGTPLPETPF